MNCGRSPLAGPRARHGSEPGGSSFVHLGGWQLTNRSTRLMRKTVVRTICSRHITQMADTSTNYQLMPGDRNYVATRTPGWHRQFVVGVAQQFRGLSVE